METRGFRAVGAEGGADFDRSFNPISTRGVADYAHHIILALLPFYGPELQPGCMYKFTPEHLH